MIWADDARQPGEQQAEVNQLLQSYKGQGTDGDSYPKSKMAFVVKSVTCRSPI